MNPTSTVCLWPFLVVSAKMILAKRVMSQSPLATRKGYRSIDQHYGRWVSTTELHYSVVTIFWCFEHCTHDVGFRSKKKGWLGLKFLFWLSKKPSFCKRPNKKPNWFYRIYGELIMIWYMRCRCMMYVWYMNVYVWYGTLIVMSWCVTTFPQGVCVVHLWVGAGSASFFYWRWRLIPFTLRDTTLVQEYWSFKMRKHFRTFMWNELINLPFPKIFPVIPVILRPCLPCFWLTVQPGASSCWGSELGWLEPEIWRGQFSQGKRPSSRKWYLEKNVVR